MEGRGRVVVRKLRLRTAAAGAAPRPALARWLTGTLEAAELEPPQMPPSAILLVRRLEGPAPGPLSGLGRAGAVRWEAGVRERLERSYAQASRPVRGELPGDAAAVLFQDPAEMTAALLLDVARGKALERWWWPCAITDRAALHDLSLAFLRELRHVPAAVAYLIAWGRAEEVALALSPRQARALAARLCGAFGLAELAPHFTSSRPEGSYPPGAAGAAARFDRAGSGQGGSAGAGGDERPRGAPAGSGGERRAAEGAVREKSSAGPGARGKRGVPAPGHGDGPGPTRPGEAGSGARGDQTAGAAGAPLAGAAGPARAPWDLPVLAAVERRGRERAALFGIAALLARSPHAVRSGRFAARFSAWWHGAQRVERPTRAAAASGGFSEPPGRGGSSGRADGGRPLTHPPAAARAREPGFGPSGPEAAGGGREGAGARTHFEAPDRPPNIASGQQSELGGTASSFRFEKQAPAALEPWGGEGCATNLGGILYLLNPMRKLQMPGCFEADWRLDSALGAWGCLQALAIGLLARAQGRTFRLQAQEVWSDPIWRLLAQIEGRDPDQPLGLGVVDPGGFRPPEGWRRFRGQAGWEPPPALPWTEIARRCPLPVAEALLRWVACAAPYLEAYIRTAAGPWAGAQFEPAGLLVVQGRIYATGSHVDLVAGLDEISLAARVAGLDADPGWDPLLGRVVQFHFR